jgi:hypothetical protein
MLFDFTLDDTMVGQSIGPQNGFLVSLRQTQSQAAYETPSGDDGSGVWKSAYFVLRGSADIRDLFCANPSQGGVVDPVKSWIVNSSLAYRGALIVRSVPRGSQWAITLSDVPVVKTATEWSAANLIATIMNEQRERVLVR